MSGSGSYIPNPVDPTQPVGSIDARTAAAEFRALKGYVTGLTGAQVTWNPADKAPFINLYSGNLLALSETNPANILTGGVRSYTGRGPGASYYLEHTIGTVTGVTEVGAATIDEIIYSPTVSKHLGQSNRSIGYRSNGQLWAAGVLIGTVAGFAFGDVIGITFNGSNITFYKNGVFLVSPLWIASTGAVPKYPVLMLSTYGDYAVTNFGATPFRYPIPGGAIPLYNANLDQTGTQNLLINSGFLVDARHNGAPQSPVANGAYMADRWAYYSNVAGVFSAQRIPTNYAEQVEAHGAIAYQRMTVIAATVPAAGEYHYISQKIEGYAWARLLYGAASALSATLLCTVRCSIAGRIGILVQNGTRTRSFVTEIILTAANVFQRFAVVIPGCPSGAWSIVGSTGAEVQFALGSGATYTAATAATWYNSDLHMAAGSINIASQTNGTTLDVTDVEIRPGYWTASDLPEYLTFAENSLNCVRYYYNRIVYNAGYTDAGINIAKGIELPVSMRAVPTGVISADANVNCVANTFSALSDSVIVVLSQGVAPGTFIQNCVVEVSAEL